MAPQTIINNKYAQLYYHPSTNIVHHHLTDLLDSEHLREVLYKGTEVLKQHGATKWLSDNRFMNPHNEEDAEWINNNWLPATIAAGWKFWALVVPQSWSAQVNLVDYVNVFYEMGVRVMVFVDPDAAMSWLETVDQT